MESKEIHDALARIYANMVRDHRGNWGMDIHHWDWVPGVGVISILEYGAALNDDAVIQYVQDWVAKNKEKAAKTKVINSMAPYAVFPELYRRTSNNWFMEQSREIARWMLEEAPRTREHAFEHTVTEDAAFPEQVWADTVFMAVLFLARYAALSGDRQVANEALQQTMIHIQLLQDQNTGLLFHGWNCEAGNHMSAVRWARANAWVVLAIPEIISEIKGLIDLPQELLTRYTSLASGLRSCQPADGLWHTVLDRTDFYKETSSSAGIACGFIKAVKSGVLDASYLQAAMCTLEGIVPLITSDGEVTGVSGGTPVMDTLEAYNQIPVIPTLYGQGLTMMLLTEAATLK